MQDVGKAVGVPHSGTTTITQPRNLSSATGSSRNLFNGYLRPVLIAVVLAFSLPFVACGGGQISASNTDVAGLGSQPTGGGLGPTATVITSEDYSMLQRLGKAQPIPTMESADYKLSNED